jgi:hypothetical protein
MYNQILDTLLRVLPNIILGIAIGMLVRYLSNKK